MQAFLDFLGTLLGLGLEGKDLSFFQISLRGAVVFIAALIMLRLGDRRALSQKTAFDTLLLVLLASVLARAINGTAAFYPTLGGSFVMVLLHRLLSQICCRSQLIGRWVKGQPYVLVENGGLCPETMRQKSISRHDVEEDLRLTAKAERLDAVQTARLERSGDVSFIMKKG